MRAIHLHGPNAQRGVRTRLTFKNFYTFFITPTHSPNFVFECEEKIKKINTHFLRNFSFFNSSSAFSCFAVVSSYSFFSSLPSSPFRIYESIWFFRKKKEASVGYIKKRRIKMLNSIKNVRERILWVFLSFLLCYLYTHDGQHLKARSPKPALVLTVSDQSIWRWKRVFHETWSGGIRYQ